MFNNYQTKTLTIKYIAMKKTLQLFLVAAIGGITALGLNHWLISKSTEAYLIEQSRTKDVKFTSSMPGALPEAPANFVEAANQTVHGVVHIKTTSTFGGGNNFSNDPFYDLLFGGRQQMPQSQQMATGSGVVISGDGYIVTNNHVVDHAEKIEVVLNDKRSYEATLIGKDPSTDLALLKIKEQNLSYVPYGNSDDSKIGEWVLAVGNPFNLTSTVTAGIISAKGRNLNILEPDPSHGIFPIESYIQTDAVINPGNSGGALVNTQGQLVGINAAIQSNTGSYSGYSFAIPVNIVKKVVADIIEFGEVQRAFMGISLRDLDSKLAEEKKITDIRGVYVNGVTEGSAGQDAGMEAGDIITKVGGATVNNIPELQEQIGRYRPGDKVDIGITRDGTEKTVSVTLKSKVGNTELVKREKGEVINILGAGFEQLNADDMKELHLKNGLKVVQLGNGKLRQAGIREGFVITQIDKKPINTIDDLKVTLENKAGGVLIEGLYPGGVKAYYGFGL